MSRFSVLPIIADHARTLRDQQTRRPRWADLAVLYVVPVAAASWSRYNGVRLQGIGELLGGLAILAGFLFTLVIFVFQLRMTVTNDPRVMAAGLLPRLIDQIFATVSYAVLVGLATTGVAMAAAATRSVDTKGDLQPVNVWWSATFVALALHLGLLLVTALRQTRVAYRQLRG